MNTVKQAQETLQRLEAELVAATDHSTWLQTERRKNSFSAHSGDAKAKAQLQKLNSSSLESGLQIENLRSAIDEAKARLASAERLAALEAQRASAVEVVALSEEALRLVKEASDGYATFCASFAKYQEALSAMRRLGATIAGQRIVELATIRAITTPARSVGLDIGDTVPSTHRQQLASVLEYYVGQATKWANGVLHHEKEAA